MLSAVGPSRQLDFVFNVFHVDVNVLAVFKALLTLRFSKRPEDKSCAGMEC